MSLILSYKKGNIPLELKIHSFMNKKIILLASLVVVFGIGFYSGTIYKTYQIAKTFSDLLDNSTTASNLNKNTVSEKIKEENYQLIEKNIGDEVTLATINFKINKVEEKQTLVPKYGSPKVADENTKFIVINADITNTTNSKFSFSTNGLILVDNKNREFSTYSDSIGAIDDYLDYRDLSPSIKENGYLIYELPIDAENYNFMIGKAGTKEYYKIILK